MSIAVNISSSGIKKPKTISAKRHFLNILLLLLVVGGLLMCLLYWKVYQSLHRDMDIQYAVEVENKRSLLNHELKELESVIDSLIRSRSFASYLNDPSDESLDQAKYMFQFIAAEHKNYLQVRYVDKSGDVLISAGSLQSSYAEPFEYGEVMSLSSERFWYSNLKLRRDNDEIVTPHQPVLRVGKAVYLGGLPRGAVLVTMDVAGLLEALITSTVFDLELVDGEGRFIYSSEEDKSWGLALGRSDSIYQRYPGLTLRNHTELKRQTSFFNSFSDVLPNDQQAYLVMRYRVDLLTALRTDYYTAALMGSGVLGLLCWWLARRFAKMQNAYEGLLQESNACSTMYFGVLDNHLMTLEVNTEGRIQKVSSALCERGHYKRSDLVGKLYSFLLEAPDPIDSLDRTENPWQLEGEAVGHTRSGEKFWVNQTVSCANDDGNNALCYTLVLDDVTDKKELERRSVTDVLTGLANRAGVTRSMGQEWRLAKRYGNAFSVILVDVDNFKTINDEHGYKVGDQVLIKMALLMRSTLRASDVCGRFASEEFMIILPHTDISGAHMFAEKLREAISGHDFAISSRVTVSMGISSFSDNDTEADIMARADMALCKAKESGENVIELEHGRP